MNRHRHVDRAAPDDLLEGQDPEYYWHTDSDNNDGVVFE